MNDVHMYQFRVTCNRTLIASFQSKHQAVAFVTERAAQHKENVYNIVEKGNWNGT